MRDAVATAADDDREPMNTTYNLGIVLSNRILRCSSNESSTNRLVAEASALTPSSFTLLLSDAKQQ